VNKWMNVRVRLNDAWGVHAPESLGTPLGPGQHPEFALRARHLRDASGRRTCAHFSVDFASGFLADGWQGVNFIPMGSVPVTWITGLPAWDAKQQNTYRKAIDAATAKLAEPQTQRLEAIIPYLDRTGCGYNKVRLFYVENAVKDPAAPDLVVVKVIPLIAPPTTVRGSQDGTGHGPPD
jgi:hypothetical protein